MIDPGLVSFEEAVEQVTALLRERVILATIYWLHDGEYQGALIIDPDVAFAALRGWQQERKPARSRAERQQPDDPG